MTYGEIRLSLAKQVPGVDPELIDGFILEIYQQILDRMSWSRIKQRITMQSPAEVNTGTVTCTLGNNVVVGSGTNWTAAITGRMFRVGGGPEYYQCTFEDPSVLLLDRPYEAGGFDNSSADDTPGLPLNIGPGLDYRINQNVYPLPPNVRLVEAVTNLDEDWPLTRITSPILNFGDGQRGEYGTPAMWLPAFDQQSNPPVAQIEIYPVPDGIYGIALDCVVEDISFGAATTSASASQSTMQVWMRPGCLKAGARALCEAHLKDWNAATFWNGRFELLTQQLVSVESTRTGPQPLRMANQYTRHRMDRIGNYQPRIRF